MKRILVGCFLTVLVLEPGCRQRSDPEQPLSITTVENTPVELKPIGSPPQIEFDQTPQAPLEGAAEEESATEEPSEAWTQDLPFSPKIAMDPVDGSKLSIRRTTPIAEYKGRIYYFASEANRRQFIASPDQYLSGAFTSYQ